MFNLFKNILVIIMMMMILVSCSKPRKVITTIADLENATIGVMNGSTSEKATIAQFPNAQLKIFDSSSDALMALKNNKIDAVMVARSTALLATKKNPDLSFFPETFFSEENALAVRKDSPELLNQLNTIITELKAEGVFEDMGKRWLKTDSTPYEFAKIDTPLEGEELKVGVCATREPLCFIGGENNEIIGYEKEFAERIATKMNRKLVLVDLKFASLITSLVSGKIDLILANMTPTEERKQSVDFTIPYFDDAQVIVVKK